MVGIIDSIIKLTNEITIKTNCTYPDKTAEHPSYYKIFVKGYKNLYEYIYFGSKKRDCIIL